MRRRGGDIDRAAGCPIETAAQISPTNTLTHNGKTYPHQSLAMPVNDLPAPYKRVHPWGEIPYDAANYDARASFIGAAEGPDGNIYVLNRCNRNSCEGRKEPPISNSVQRGNCWRHGVSGCSYSRTT